MFTLCCKRKENFSLETVPQTIENHLNWDCAFFEKEADLEAFKKRLNDVARLLGHIQNPDLALSTNTPKSFRPILQFVTGKDQTDKNRVLNAVFHALCTLKETQFWARYEEMYQEVHNEDTNLVWRKQSIILPANLKEKNFFRRTLEKLLVYNGDELTIRWTKRFQSTPEIQAFVQALYFLHANRIASILFEDRSTLTTQMTSAGVRELLTFLCNQNNNIRVEFIEGSEKQTQLIEATVTNLRPHPQMLNSA